MDAQSNEIVTLILGICMVLFFFANRRQIRTFPQPVLYLASYATLVVAWLFTVAEGFVWPESLNYLEHVFYMLSSLLFFTWVTVVYLHSMKKER